MAIHLEGMGWGWGTKIHEDSLPWPWALSLAVFVLEKDRKVNPVEDVGQTLIELSLDSTLMWDFSQCHNIRYTTVFNNPRQPLSRNFIAPRWCYCWAAMKTAGLKSGKHVLSSLFQSERMAFFFIFYHIIPNINYSSLQKLY